MGEGDFFRSSVQRASLEAPQIARKLLSCCLLIINENDKDNSDIRDIR